MGSDSEGGIRPIKVILVGSSGVGKTSLINSYFEQPHDTETTSTVAPAFVATTVKLDDNQRIDLHIWDTAGQERFQSIGAMFYRDSDVAFICFDRTMIDTAGDWVDRVRRQVPECIIFLVGTKSDVLDSIGKSEFTRDGQRKVTEVEASKFYLTSASTGLGVKELFRDAAKCSEQVCAPAAPSTVPVDPPSKGQKKNGCSC
jgi:small GTP-binding protein